MPQLQVPIVRTSALPPGYCYPSPEQFFEDIVARIIGQFTNNMSGVIIGPTAPGVNDRDKLWFNTNLNDNQIYSWVLSIGAWARKYIIEAGSGIHVWFPTVSAMTTEGGGNSNAVGDADGPFWAIEPNLVGRFPISAGLIPNSNPAVTLVETDTGGINAVTLNMTNIPSHGHGMPASTTKADPGTSAGPWENVPIFENGTAWRPPSDNKDHGVAQFVWQGGDPSNANATVAFNNMNPYTVGVWAMRTARIWALPL